VTLARYARSRNSLAMSRVELRRLRTRGYEQSLFEMLAVGVGRPATLRHDSLESLFAQYGLE
jgi:hypothetical protein